MEINLTNSIIINLTLALVIIGLVRIILVNRSKIKTQENDLERFKPILDIEAEAKAKKGKLQEEINLIEKELKKEKKSADKLKSKYESQREIFKKLNEQISIYREDIEMLEFGLYTPLFNYNDSEKYKNAIVENRSKQKILIKENKAAINNENWEVNGNKKKGQAMKTKTIKMTLFAFNGECDALISKVKWNNLSKIRARIEKLQETINKLNSANKTRISDEFVGLKIQELQLTHEADLKRHEEKEEQRRIREQMREEEKVRREIEKAQKEAEEDERRYNIALDKAQKEVAKATGKEFEDLTNEIERLKKEIQQAHNNKDRAISMAQVTKSGHVYVISNIGSFGENIYKIGMTRRLDPYDRVKELSDASVPFQFDVHAVIYSKDAPNLEKKLHKAFEKNRVNLVNHRKEFFNVGLEKIEKLVSETADSNIKFTKLAEAQEYRETTHLVSKLSKKSNNLDELVEIEFPEDIFT